MLMLASATQKEVESVADNILLNIPLKVLTAEEEAGQDFPVTALQR